VGLLNFQPLKFRSQIWKASIVGSFLYISSLFFFFLFFSCIFSLPFLLSFSFAFYYSLLLPSSFFLFLFFFGISFLFLFFFFEEEEALCNFQRFWMLVRPRRSSLSEISSEILRLENSVSSTFLLWVLPACSLKSAGRNGGRQIKCAHAHIVCPPF